MILVLQDKKRVNCHSTPFVKRLESTLDRRIAWAFCFYSHCLYHIIFEGGKKKYKGGKMMGKMGKGCRLLHSSFSRISFGNCYFYKENLIFSYGLLTWMRGVSFPIPVKNKSRRTFNFSYGNINFFFFFLRMLSFVSLFLFRFVSFKI